MGCRLQPNIVHSCLLYIQVFVTPFTSQNRWLHLSLLLGCAKALTTGERLHLSPTSIETTCTLCSQFETSFLRYLLSPACGAPLIVSFCLACAFESTSDGVMRPRKDLGASGAKGGPQPSHFRFPHFLKPLAAPTTSTAASGAEVASIGHASYTGMQPSTAPAISTSHAFLGAARSAGSTPLRSSASPASFIQRPPQPCASESKRAAGAEAQALALRVASVGSSNALAHSLLRRWRGRLEALGSQSSQSPSIVCETLLLELEADLRKASFVGTQKVPAGPELDDAQEEDGSDNPNAYGPLTIESIGKRRQQRAQRSSSIAGGALSQGPLLDCHKDAVRAMVAVGLLRHSFSPQHLTGGEAPFYRLVSLLVDAAFCEHARGQCPNAAHFVDDNGEGASAISDVPAAPLGAGVSMVRRSYRELYEDLAAKRDHFNSRPERVLERLGVQKNRFILRLIFTAWRAGYRRRARQLHESSERAEYLFRMRRRAALARRFGQWRRYVQAHGRHHRVLQYRGSKEKLIQRLARRVEGLEAERKRLAADLAAMRASQSAAVGDLQELRRLVLGDEDAARFEQLMANKRTREAAERASRGDEGAAAPLSSPPEDAPEHEGQHTARPRSEASAVDGAPPLRPDTPIAPPSGEAEELISNLPSAACEATGGSGSAILIGRAALHSRDVRTPGPSPFRAHTVLRDHLRRLEEEGGMGLAADGSAAGGGISPSHSALTEPPNGSGYLSVDAEGPATLQTLSSPSEPACSHTQLLDWVAVRCQRMAADLQATSGLAAPNAEWLAMLAKRPRNFVADFADGSRMAFLLLSVGVSDRLLAESLASIPAADAEGRRALLQAAMDSLQGVGGDVGGSTMASERLELTGSKCAKAVRTLFTHFQGAAVVGLSVGPPPCTGTTTGTRMAAAASLVPSQTSPRTQRRRVDLKKRIQSLMSGADGSDSARGSAPPSPSPSASASSLEDSLGSLYERHYTEEELAAKSRALASDSEGTAGEGSGSEGTE